MIERRGISRVRHIDVDNLWIQEKEARRMMPIDKVFGGDSPADLMTKNVGIDLAIKHMTAMGIRFAEGRSGAAAKLHMLEQKDTPKIEKQGVNVNMVKVHGISRKERYSTSKKEEYPVHNGDLEAIRVTTGVTASGKVFEIEDNWKETRSRTKSIKRRLDRAYDFLRASARKKLRAVSIAAPKERQVPAGRMEPSRRADFAASAAGEHGR